MANPIGFEGEEKPQKDDYTPLLNKLVLVCPNGSSEIGVLYQIEDTRLYLRPSMVPDRRVNGMAVMRIEKELPTIIEIAPGLRINPISQEYLDDIITESIDRTKEKEGEKKDA